jgi:hypothetical protein
MPTCHTINSRSKANGLPQGGISHPLLWYVCKHKLLRKSIHQFRLTTTASRLSLSLQSTSWIQLQRNSTASQCSRTHLVMRIYLHYLTRVFIITESLVSFRSSSSFSPCTIRNTHTYIHTLGNACRKLAHGARSGVHY